MNTYEVMSLMCGKCPHMVALHIEDPNRCLVNRCDCTEPGLNSLIPTPAPEACTTCGHGDFKHTRSIGGNHSCTFVTNGDLCSCTELTLAPAQDELPAPMLYGCAYCNGTPLPGATFCSAGCQKAATMVANTHVSL
jgi:hypothetical protein